MRPPNTGHMCESGEIVSSKKKKEKKRKRKRKRENEYKGTKREHSFSCLSLS